MKKILIFSHNSFSTTSNNGKTLSNLFSLFPPEKLGQFYLSNEAPNTECCQTFFQLTDMDLLKFNRGRVVKPNLENKNTFREKNKTPFKKNSLTKLLRNLIWCAFPCFNSRLNDWLLKEKFDVVFFVAGDYIFSNILARRLSDKFNMDLATYFTDDYILSINNRSTLSKINHFFLKKSTMKTINKSKSLFSIGEEMSIVYKNYFKRDFTPLMNCVDTPTSDLTLRENILKPKFIYMGGLHLGRLETLILLGKEISQVNKDFTIDIYSLDTITTGMKKMCLQSNIRFNGGVGAEEVEGIIKEASFLIHVESFNSKYRQLTRLSVSTKLPEYFMSGVPVIACGPMEVASLKLIEKYKLGFIFDAENSKKSESLMKYILNQNLQKEFSKRAYQFACNNFDKKKVSNELFKILNDVTIQK